MKKSKQIQQIRISANTPKEIKAAIITKMKRKTLKPYQLTPTKLAKAMSKHFPAIHKPVSFDDGL